MSRHIACQFSGQGPESEVCHKHTSAGCDPVLWQPASRHLHDAGVLAGLEYLHLVLQVRHGIPLRVAMQDLDGYWGDAAQQSLVHLQASLRQEGRSTPHLPTPRQVSIQHPPTGLAS